MRLIEQRSGNGSEVASYGSELTPHVRLGRLVLIADVMLFAAEAESRRKGGWAKLRVVAPDYFENMDDCIEMMGIDEDPATMDFLEKAHFIAKYEASAEIEAREISSMDEFHELLEMASRDQLMYDATVDALLHDDEKRELLRTGPSMADTEAAIAATYAEPPTYKLMSNREDAYRIVLFRHAVASAQEIRDKIQDPDVRRLVTEHLADLRGIQGELETDLMDHRSNQEEDDLFEEMKLCREELKNLGVETKA